MRLQENKKKNLSKSYENFKRILGKLPDKCEKVFGKFLRDYNFWET